jgi:hypothetical protein
MAYLPPSISTSFIYKGISSSPLSLSHTHTETNSYLKILYMQFLCPGMSYFNIKDHSTVGKKKKDNGI